MPIYAWRCRDCGQATDGYHKHDAVPDAVPCPHCGSVDTYRIIGASAYLASESTRTARLDPKYDKAIDRAMHNSRSADPEAVIRRVSARSAAARKPKP